MDESTIQDALVAARTTLDGSKNGEYQVLVQRSQLDVIVDRLTMLTAICDSMSDGVFVKNLDGTIVMTNTAGPESLSLQPSDVLGKTAVDLFSDQTAARIKREDTTVISGEIPLTFEDTEVVGDEEHTFLTTKLPFRNNEGVTVGILAITKDITRQKQSEIAQRRHESRFSRLLEAAPDAIVGIDREGKIILVNAQVEQMFGYQREELAGKHIECLMPDRFRGDHSVLREQYVEEPRTRPMGHSYDLIARRKDGSEFSVEISLSPFDTDEGIFVTSIIRDITDRKAMERQLREHTVNLEEQVIQSERLATIGRMAAQVAHEIRNPLSTIGLNIELLADEIDAKDWKERSEADDLIQITLSEIERLNSVISDYLQFARMPAHQMHDLATNDLAGEVCKFIRPEADVLGIDVELILGEDMDPVRIDPIIFRQAVLNCVRNALEAMPDGGKLTIATAMKGFHVELSVTDSGAGIKTEDQSRVFDPFYSTKDRGTGLGLPYVRQIVAEYGGSLDLCSMPGEGTTVAIRLPSSLETEN